MVISLLDEFIPFSTQLSEFCGLPEELMLVYLLIVFSCQSDMLHHSEGISGIPVLELNCW